MTRRSTSGRPLLLLASTLLTFPTLASTKSLRQDNLEKLLTSPQKILAVLTTHSPSSHQNLNGDLTAFDVP